MKLIIFLWNLVSKLFLPVTAVILLVFAVVTTRRSIMIFKIKKMLTSRGMRDVKLRFLPNLLKRKKRYDIEYSDGKQRVNLVIFPSVKKYIRYNIENINRIERYVIKMTSFKGNGRAFVSKNKEYVQKRSLFMPWENADDGNLNVIVFNNFPNHLSDINTRDSLLGNGDKTVGGIVVYDINGFGEYLSLRK